MESHSSRSFPSSLRLGYSNQLSVPLLLSLLCPRSRKFPNCKRPKFFPRRRRKTIPSTSIKKLEPHQFISKMSYFTSFLKPGGYRRLGDLEKPTHRAAIPDGSLFPQDESEIDLFLPSSSRTHPQQEAVLYHRWRLAFVVLLFVCNICFFACVAFHLDAAPLEVRQKECGRLLGQWRRFTTFLKISRIMWLACTLYEITKRTIVFFFLSFTFCFPSFTNDENAEKENPFSTVPGWQDGVEYEVQRFKGNFGLQSPFTGVGPEVDAAWYNLTDGKSSSSFSLLQSRAVRCG